MTFATITEDEFKDVLAANFTPSATIKTPERLYGREKALKTIDRAFASPGRQVFIYGDRGVGKTSLAQTAALLQQHSGTPPIYTVCSHTETFGNVLKAIGNATVSVQDRIETGGSSRSFGASVLGVGGNYKGAEAKRAVISSPDNMNEALDIVRYVLSKRDGNQVVIIDEMERISDAKERQKFAEFIKNVPEVSDRVKFIFCGIANTVDELIGAHPSAGRILETINLEKLHHNYLWDIISNVAHKVDAKVSQEMLIRIGQISDGFPHYVHLIGESMFWDAFDDPQPVMALGTRHFKEGIRGALTRAEATLRQQYERATMKTKNTEDYEEALWSLADTTSDRRQLSEVYDSSYKRIMFSRPKRVLLTKDKFNQRLLALRKDGHGSVVVGYGSGWFGFRENIIRGYVRLRAEGAGVELGREIR